MNTQSDAMAPLEVNVAVPVVIPAARRFYWSVRRELWENRSLYLAPLAVAALFLAGFLISAIHPPAQIGDAMALDPLRHQELVEQPYTFAAFVFMATTLIVSVFYCLDALHGERRDRSILFWKSLPVSDLTTVLAKASIPLLILPLLTFAVTFLTQCIMLLLSSAVMLARGQSVAALWSHLPLFQMSVGLLFHLVAIHGLQFAPIYCWMLLVSGWARRAALLWAVIPPLAIVMAEKIAFNTSHFCALLAFLFGSGPEGVPFTAGKMEMAPLIPLAVGKFFINPGLLAGLAVSAAFLAAAVRLRRYRDPI
jgi:ABC-2 type transport system permease protein